MRGLCLSLCLLAGWAGEAAPVEVCPPAGTHWLMMVGTRNTDPGRDGEFNRWYDEVDIPDVLKVPGYRRARRGARISSPADDSAAASGNEVPPYVALYEIETSNIDGTIIDMLMAARRMDTLGRSTPLLEVTERLYFRQLAAPHLAATDGSSHTGRQHYLLLERVDCCRDDAAARALNDWYDHQYLPEMLRLTGVHSATRYELHRVVMVEPKSFPRFLAIYEIDSDAIESVLEARRRSRARLEAAGRMSEWFQERGTVVYRQIRDISGP